MTDYMREFHPQARILMGPGPSNVNARVLQAMASPVVGHLDPQFVNVMIEVREMLRPVFGTNNNLTLVLSGSGSAGMEAAVCNLVERGEKMLVAVNGYFGMRMAEVARRAGAEVTVVESQWGKAMDANAIEAALKKLGKVKAVGIIHGETSTGVMNPIPDISKLVHDHGGLLIMDAVTTLGGAKVDMAGWDVDICYSGTQKCLATPPGLSPISVGPRGIETLKTRKTQVQSYYLDLAVLADYWSRTTPRYHHTAPISMFYAFREALRMLHEEGLEARWARHAWLSSALCAGVQGMGLQLFADPKYRLAPLTTICIPQGVDDAKLRGTLLDEFNLEIGAGFGPLAGKIWRVGLMGETCRPQNVFYFLSCLERGLLRQGYEVPVGAGEAAAAKVIAEGPGK